MRPLTDRRTPNNACRQCDFRRLYLRAGFFPFRRLCAPEATTAFKRLTAACETPVLHSEVQKQAAFGISPPSKFFQNSATRLPLLSGFRFPVSAFPFFSHSRPSSVIRGHLRTSASLRLCARYLYALPPYCATLRLPPWATHLSFPLDMRYRAGVRSRSCHPSGCLRQATRPAPAGTCSALRFPVSFSPNKTLHLL